MSVAISELQSTATEKTARTFFGSTLKELLPLIIVAVVAVGILAAAITINVLFQINLAESQMEAARNMKGLRVG